MDDIVHNLDSKSPPPKKSDQNGSFFFLRLIFFVAIVLDQLVKHFQTLPFLNYNFAFSLPIPIAIIYVIYFCVLAGMIYYVAKHHQQFSFPTKLAWTLIFAGAVSNIGERIILGYVRDFIYISFYHWTGIYNLADGYIITGVLLLLLIPRSLRNTKIY